MTIDFVACLATSWVALDTDLFDEDLFLFVGIVRCSLFIVLIFINLFQF